MSAVLGVAYCCQRVRSGAHHMLRSARRGRVLVAFQDRLQDGRMLPPKANLANGVIRREQHGRALSQTIQNFTQHAVLPGRCDGLMELPVQLGKLVESSVSQGT